MIEICPAFLQVICLQVMCLSLFSTVVYYRLSEESIRVPFYSFRRLSRWTLISGKCKRVSSLRSIRCSVLRSFSIKRRMFANDVNVKLLAKRERRFFRASNWRLPPPSAESIFEYSLANLKSTRGQSRACQPRAGKRGAVKEVFLFAYSAQFFRFRVPAILNSPPVAIVSYSLSKQPCERNFFVCLGCIQKAWCIVNFSALP